MALSRIHGQQWRCAYQRSRWWPMAVALALTSSLYGCAGATVTVPTTFPVPLVEKLPLRMGVHLTPELLDYTHHEELENLGEWTIDLGDAQEPMFRNLLTGMFEDYALVADPRSPDANVDAVLVPNIEEVQFSIPSQSRNTYYEVWIKYQFQLYSRDGTLLADFPMTAYGKANEKNYGMQADEPALQAAALAACRDAMAFFTTQFQAIPPVKDWLTAESGGLSS